MKKKPSTSQNLVPTKAPSNRQKRVAEEIRQVLAGIISRGDFFSPELRDRSITVTQVTVSPDLRNALIFVMPLGGEHIQETLTHLKKYRGELRYLLSKELQLRYVPNLKFVLDDAIEQAAKIGELFAKIKTPDSSSEEEIE
ncbi:30S ribosome-binding factor RbfA [Candidatus Paracaedibacter symbiosus]|uniref:30S ribosome-binding factor RbfA n=1 Tax=Candidatus Paracaedibacter symbiosus TaxID=244582 RepID=UPI0006925D2B|nr:30S ribosome-binding factor RbfA [Candidatus Paracaedibacter symbiosus]